MYQSKDKMKNGNGLMSLFRNEVVNVLCGTPSKKKKKSVRWK